jgi:hypothetical protein
LFTLAVPWNFSLNLSPENVLERLELQSGFD